MAEKKLITENDLDSLLRDMYLDENSKTPNERDANFVMEQEYPVSIDPAKEAQLLAKLQTNPGGFFGTGKFIISICVIALLSFLAFYLFSGKDKASGVSPNVVEDNKTTAGPELPMSDATTKGIASNPPDTNGTLLKVTDTFDHPKTVHVAHKIDSSATNVITVRRDQKPEEPVKTVPFLTEKDKLKYRAIKTQMLANIVKLHKGLYTKIPAYKTDYAGKATILDAFTLRNVGITNLEYKTFLADLLAQGKNDIYLKCQVHQENWAKQGYPNLAESYFGDASYNDFPVVNISYEAAKLFCKWLEEETKSYILQNNLKLKPLQIRLPYDEEWVFAAREGYAKIAFEKGYNTIYDEGVGLVNKSFTNRVEMVKKHAEHVDTLYSYYSTNRYGWNEKDLADFLKIGMNGYRPAPLDTIIIDRMKLMGKIGHVSEMVPQKNTGKLWLSGLSWKSKEEYQKLEAEFKTNLSSPFVGFRVVVVNPNDPEYKKPFW